MFFLIIDANIWIKYARNKNIAPLLDRFTAYSFIPVVNNYLLSEIFDASVDNKWMHPSDAIKVVNFINKISYHTAEKAVYRLSPDPKDNYLIDLAIQNHCLFIITDDTKLLKFQLSPVLIRSGSWFIKKFPVATI